jgi:transposase
METIFTCCAGLDVHQKSVWACARRLESDGRVAKQIKCFGTMTRDLIELAAWLKEQGATHAAMESTGVLWKPVYNILEEHLEVWLCNARDMRNVPGRKTDAKDCEWIAQLMQCGLLRKSFVPPKPVRELRDLTRTRTCLEDDKTRVVNRIHKVLEDANIKLSAVASDILGVSGRAMLWKLIQGESDPRILAAEARRKLKSKKEALTEALRGHVTEHHRFMLRLLMDQVGCLEKEIVLLDERITQVMTAADAAAREAEEKKTPSVPQPQAANPGAQEEAKRPLPFLEARKLLEEMWGIKQRGAENMLAEVGTDMSRFPTPRHFASWAGMCPGNNQSAGKNRSGATRRGNNWLRRALAQAAWGASRAKQSFLSARFGRLVKRRGKARTIVAVGHSMLKVLYRMLEQHKAYKDLGTEHYKTANVAACKRRLVQSLQRLGFTVQLTARSEPVPA